MDFNAFLTLFCGVALLAAKPGPGMMTVATKAMGEGLTQVIYFMIGTNLVKIFFFTLVVFGYSLVAEKALFITILLKSFTALYLIWLGAQGLRKPDPEAEANQAIVKKTGFSENFLAGLMLTISNPFDILFFAGILPTILDVNATITLTQYITCAVVIVAADALVALSYAAPIALSRRFFIRPVVRKLNIVSSIGLVLVGLYIGYTAMVPQ